MGVKRDTYDGEGNLLESIDTRTSDDLLLATIEKRKAEYGPIEQQIEFMTENGLEAWQAKVAQIKLDNPKGE